MKDDAAPGRHDAAATTRGEGVAALLAESGFASASELRAALAELAQRREHVDPLTGLPDRLRCLQWFSVDDHAWGADAPRALLLLDLDLFKPFNDTHGWVEGDRMLARIAQRLRALARPGDLLFRLEFEEFVVVMERGSHEALIADADALRRAVADAGWVGENGREVRVTASGGLAFLRRSGFRYAAFQQADTAMYMAKILGRDQMVLHEDVRRLAADHGTSLELADLSELAEAAKERLAGMAEAFNRRLLAAAQQEANADGLTGVFNRRYFDARLERELVLARRDARNLTLAFLDIDDFRAVNNTYGHPTGDVVLRRFAQIVGGCIRDADWLARYGGEEFCLVMPVTAADAGSVAERIRGAVAGARLQALDGRELAFTVSVGVVAFDAALDPDREHFVHRASKANRAAKDAGKDRVVVA